MPVPTHMKFVFRGKFLNTPEEWSFGLKVSRDNPGGADASYGEIVEPTVDAACHALLDNANFASSVVMTDWRAYVIGTNGLTEGNPMLREFAAGTEPKGTGTVRYPTDISVCVTTEATNRGPARLGRFYLPSPALSPDTDHRLSIASANIYLNLAVAFTKSVSDAVDLELTQSAELLNISALGAAGARQTVRNLRVGRVLDRLERRRRSMLEDYEVSGTIDW